MNALLVAQAAVDGGWSTVMWAGVIAALILVPLVIFGFIYASRYVKVGPNEVLIVSGLKNTMRDAKGIERSVGFVAPQH